MIYDSIQHIEAYRGIHPGVYRGLEILRDTDFSKLEDKRYEVDGEDLFFFVQSYESKPANDTPEAHRKYIDIQYVISGEEKMGVGPLDEITLANGRFAVLWPGDAHAPGIAVGQPAPCRKCVIKVKVER